MDRSEELRSAVRRGDGEATQQVLRASRSSIDVADEEFGNTALHWAVMGGFVQMAIMLLEAGADPNRANKDGLRPLALAKDFGLTESLST